MNAEAKLEELMASDPKIREEYLTNKNLGKTIKKAEYLIPSF